MDEVHIYPPQLGRAPKADEQRDAVHMAIIPVVAAGPLRVGGKVVVRQGVAYPAENDWEAIGVVDPFLPAPLGPGDRFWLVMRPCTVTSLRHEWTHAHFPLEGKAPSQQDIDRSKLWILNFASSYGVSYEELVEGALSGAGCVFRGSDHHGPLGSQQAEDREFWSHLQAVTGRLLSEEHRENTYFGCTC